MFNKPNLRNQLSKNLINIVGLTAGVVIGCPVLAQTNSPANSGIISCPSVANPTTTGTGTTSSLNNTTGAGNLGATASGGNTIVNSPLGSPSTLITPPVSGLNTTTAGTGTTSTINGTTGTGNLGTTASGGNTVLNSPLGSPSSLTAPASAGLNTATTTGTGTTSTINRTTGTGNLGATASGGNTIVNSPLGSPSSLITPPVSGLNTTTAGTGTNSTVNNTTGAGNLGATASGGNTIVNSPLGSPSSLITPPVSGLNTTTAGTGTNSTVNNTTGASNLGATANGGNTIVNSPLGSPSSLITPPVSGLNTTTAGTGTTSSLVSPANAGFSTPNLNRTSTIGSLGTTNSTVVAACPGGVTPTNTQR